MSPAVPEAEIFELSSVTKVTMSLPDANHLTTAAIIRLATSLFFFCAISTCVLWAVTTCIDRVNQVNDRLPPGERIGFGLGFVGPERNPRFEKEYERLFPDRAMRNKERILWALGALALIGLVVSISPLL